MPDESKINVATGFNGGISVSLRADSADELDALVASVAASRSASLFTEVTTRVTFAATSEQQALANVQQAFPQASNVVQMPTQSQQITAALVGPPPGVAYPGDCDHGVRKYVDKPANGRPWQRWECAIPWSRGVQGRCATVNV
jgi:hypothetical protein